MLKLPLAGRRWPSHLRDLLDGGRLPAPIGVAGHCYGCTAGQGSSCGGALAPDADTTEVRTLHLEGSTP